MASLGNIYLKFGADVSQLTQGFADVQKQLGGFGKSISSLGNVLSGAFAGLSLGQLAIDAVKMSAAIETSFLKIKNLTDTSAEDLKYFKDNLAGISSQVGRSQKELSEGLYAITSSGLVGKEALDALKVSSQASAIGLGDTETVARSLTAVMNAYGKENITAQRTAEVLFQTLKFGKLEASELAPALGRILPTSQVLGVSFEQVGAAIAQMSLSGANASEAVTNLRSIMAALIAPSELANKTLARYGITMEEVRRMAKEDLSKALLFLNEKLEGNTEAINDVLGRQEAFTGFFSVVGQNAENYGKIVQGVTADTNDFSKANDEVAQSFQGRYDRALSAAINLYVDLGNVLKDRLVLVYEAIEAFNKFGDSVSTSFKKGIDAIKSFIGLQKESAEIESSFGQKVFLGDPGGDPGESGFSSRVFTGDSITKSGSTKSPSQKIPTVTKPIKVPKPDTTIFNEISRDVENFFNKMADELAEWEVTVGTLPLTAFEEKVYAGTVGLKELSTEIIDQTGLLGTWAGEMYKAPAAAESLVTGLTPAMQALQSFNDQLSSIINEGISDTITSLGEQIGSALAGGGFNFAALLTPLVDVLTNIGKLAISTGVAMLGIKAAFKGNPFTAIAAGVALVALGTFVKSKLSNASNKFAKGVLSYGEHTGIIGDNPNARFDPEVTAPSSKLRSLFENVTLPKLANNFHGVGSRSFQPIELSFSNTEFKISGSDLVLVLDRNKAIQQRQRGY